jgi:hypothetical protein
MDDDALIEHLEEQAARSSVNARILAMLIGQFFADHPDGRNELVGIQAALLDQLRSQGAAAMDTDPRTAEVMQKRSVGYAQGLFSKALEWRDELAKGVERHGVQ